MNHRLTVLGPIAIALVVLGALQVRAQQNEAIRPAPPNSDPYANNADAGTMQFPLAAPAGKDSGAISKAAPRRRQSGCHRREYLEVRPRFRRARRTARSGIR